MKKSDLLRNIADAAYNVGFGAKKHFATFDLTTKVPGAVGFISTGVGIFGLFCDVLSTKSLSATFIVLGVMGILISMWDHKKTAYAEAGTRLTEEFNKLKVLYFNVKAVENGDLAAYEAELMAIEKECSGIGLSDQILFSGWFAHYKFFWEHQIDWIDEQKHFRLFRDRLPLSFTLSCILVLLGIVAFIVLKKWGG